ncbi:MAG TPA: AmmeMemoRadiSam system radical SAM enzyme [Caldilineae bacterium]|nr:AmmeMemoRadiSam system radical SAM enzyme [Caldilineae bacterium]
MIKEALLQRPLRRGYVQCTACEHWCAIAPGEAGKCGVRRNLDGSLKLVIYGKAVAVNVDPVEKKPLFHFLPAQSIFSIGTVGCNFRCRFCQNWEISQFRDFDPNDPRLGYDLPPEQVIAICRQRGIPMVALTYNEPAVFFEYAYDTCRLAHDAGILTAFVSSGFETKQALDLIAPYLDAINVDLKSFNDRFYREICGGRLQPVLRNIEYIWRETDIWIEVTTLVIPGLNDSDAELRDAAQFLVEISPDIPWHLTAFHPNYRMLDRPSTPTSTLIRAYEIAQEAGLRYVYVGNVLDHTRESTYCPICGTLLIERAGYRVRVLWSQPGVCHRCGYRIPGVWTSEDRAGAKSQTTQHRASGDEGR